MKCLRKYDWVKLPRSIPDMGKGRMGYWAKLASRAAFRKGNSKYCGHTNPVTPGMWAGGAVGLTSILGVRSRATALEVLEQLAALGYVKYSLDPVTKKLTYEITDWVIKCSGAECMDGAVYTTEGFGFICLPRNITERLFEQKQTFEEADAWLDLWCHTTFEDRGNAFSFLSPVIQYGKFGAVLTLETLGQRWGWEKTKVWRCSCIQRYGSRCSPGRRFSCWRWRTYGSCRCKRTYFRWRYNPFGSRWSRWNTDRCLLRCTADFRRPRRYLCARHYSCCWWRRSDRWYTYGCQYS